MKIYQFIILIIIFLSRAAPAISFDSNGLAVFYPEAQEPYRSIYQDIISGLVKANSKSVVYPSFEEFILKKDFDAAVIIKELRQKKIGNVIVLGRLGYLLAKELPKDFNVISGALPITPNGVSGISLIADPAYLFDYLRQVAPQVQKIHLAYSEKSEWLIEQAQAAAKSHGLMLDAKRVTTTKDAIDFYQMLFDTNISNKDAIWLPLDSITSHDQITLPLILEKAWSKEVVVFSSKPSHVKRGVLFSTYPDNVDLGEHLFYMVNELALSPENKIFAPLSSLQLAVNLRTAAHLGLTYSTEVQQQFKLTFPE